MTEKKKKVITVTLNPAIDQTVIIPNFAAGKVNRVVRSQSDPGGKGVNVASNLADFGLQTAVTGFLGADNTALFERLFAQKQIEDHFVRIKGSTRTGIKISDEVKQETTDINFPGQSPGEEEIQMLFQIIDQLIDEASWFVLSGSIPGGCRRSIYGDLVRRITAKGGMVALDSSGEALRLALTEAPTLIKPNNHELAELTGHPMKTRPEIISAARSLLDQGIQTVVVSLGADGAIFIEEGQVVLAVPPQVDVKSTVGAGDAMVSGIVAAKLEGQDLAGCACLATAFSVAAISHFASGLPSLEQIETVKEKVIVKNL